MKPIKILMLLLTVSLMFSCSPEDGPDENRKITQADIVGEFYWYYNADVPTITYGEREIMEDCQEKSGWLDIRANGRIDSGPFGENCEKRYANHYDVGDWEYVRVSEKFENTLVISVKKDRRDSDSEWGITLTQDGLFQIFPHRYSYKKLTVDGGSYAGWWKKR